MKIKNFWADRSGAVVSEFVLLTGALIMGVSATMTTLTSSLGLEAQTIGEEISLVTCISERQTDLSAGPLMRSECK